MLSRQRFNNATIAVVSSFGSAGQSGSARRTAASVEAAESTCTAVFSRPPFDPLIGGAIVGDDHLSMSLTLDTNPAITASQADSYLELPQTCDEVPGP
jgi:hypothetical protein